MTLIPVRKELLVELIDLKLIHLDSKIGKILTKWNYNSSYNFIQDIKEGKITASETAINKINDLLTQKNELIELKNYNNVNSETLSKDNKKSSLLKIKKILEEFKKIIVNLYGEKLREIVLYGSYARGEEKEDSDIDLAIILKGEIRPFVEIDRIVDATYSIGLQHDVLISVHPVSETEYLTRNTPFLSNVKEEGIKI
ncbi:MAG TPA: nucleotidyltransferase domain-containing protein [Candidatus Lokiarchaeia archaeon]